MQYLIHALHIDDGDPARGWRKSTCSGIGRADDDRGHHLLVLSPFLTLPEREREREKTNKQIVRQSALTDARLYVARM